MRKTLLSDYLGQNKIFHQMGPNFCIWPLIYLLNNALLFFFFCQFAFRFQENQSQNTAVNEKTTYLTTIWSKYMFKADIQSTVGKKMATGTSTHTQ